MAKALRTGVVALTAVVVGVVGVALHIDPADTVATSSDEPPSTRVAARATAEMADALAGRERGVERASRGASRGPGWQQQVGEAALERLAYNWQAIGYDVVFLPGRAGYLGMTWPERHRIEIYVRDGMSVDEVARNTAHELGHAFDFTFNTDASRNDYKRLRGISSAGWLTCRGCTDLSTPAGDFAETFSFVLMGGEFPSRSRLAPAPDPGQLQLLRTRITPPH